MNEPEQVNSQDDVTPLAPYRDISNHEVSVARLSRLPTRLRPLGSFWKQQVAPNVPQKSCRDHFALERTFLGYLRTSLAFAFLAVIIAQFFRLEHVERPDRKLGYFVLGKPLAAICIGLAIFSITMGCYRFWRQQNAMLRGKIHAGGPEINMIACLVLMLILLLFTLTLTVDIRKSLEK